MWAVDSKGDSQSKARNDAESDKSATSALIDDGDLTKHPNTARGSPFVLVLLVLSWISLSSLVILSNKYILDTAGFHYPVTLTCWHLCFSSTATHVLARTTRLLDSRKKLKMTGRIYLRTIVPIGILYSGSLVFSNLPYMTLSVAFIQMLKGLGPAAILIATSSLGLEMPTRKTWLNIIAIVVGTIIASFGEIRFVLSGFMFQMGGLLFEAYRLALVQRLLSSEESKTDPLVSLYYYSPVCALMIFVLALFTDLPSLTIQDLLHVGLWTLAANAVTAFLLNVSSVLLIGKTSSVVLTLCGVLKNIIIVLASVLIWNTVVTVTQVAGYAVATVGLLYYSFGDDTIHSFIPEHYFSKVHTNENPIARRRRKQRVIASMLLTVVVLAGAIGGVLAGYKVEMDPRVYWYSMTRLSNSKSCSWWNIR